MLVHLGGGLGIVCEKALPKRSGLYDFFNGIVPHLINRKDGNSEKYAQKLVAFILHVLWRLFQVMKNYLDDFML